MKKEYERFLKNYEDYREMSQSLDQKDVTMMDYKAVACGVGTYPQRDDKHMLRLRIPGGRFTRRDLGVILDICGEYNVKTFKFSTGQSIQIHDLATEEIRHMMPAFWEKDILTMGTGGNNPANVMASPLSGVEEGEYFDVMPYAEAVSKFLVDSIGVLKLPRKFKVGFSSSDANETHATFKDMGFAATSEGTFEVYGAGGLGIQPRLGVKFADHVQPEEVLYYLKAMMLVFSEKGNYLNWKKARSRYLQETLGVDNLRNMVLEKAEQLKKEENLDLPAIQERTTEKSGKGELAESIRVRRQKQHGLYAVLFHPAGGFLAYDRLKALYELTRDMEEVEYRLSVDGGVYVINCNAEETLQVLEATPEGAKTAFETSVSCVGRSRCAIGACNSQALLAECMKAVLPQGFEDGVLPRIAISGCISSCSAHQAAAIGFRGIMKRTTEGVSPAFHIFWGGCDEKGKEVLAESTKVLLAEDVPQFLIELGRTVQASEEKNYKKWILNHGNVMEAMIERHAFV
ncbi:MAG: nitrite/sulfite reductase [Eubacteriales bacterium]|nr:nitrite/sulfite reductase [Eubacteriales bacterium]